MTVDTPAAPPTPEIGAFRESLLRNNKKIRSDRAESIVEDAQTLFKRTIEDMQINIRRMERERENMLDMSPENTMTLLLATDFKAQEYVNKEIEIGVSIRNEDIKLKIAKDRYKALFGGTI